MLLELRDVTFGYGHTAVVRDLSIRVAQGESVAIVGESGSGKSTLLKGLLGMASFLGGEVRLRGQVKDLGADPRALASAIQMIPQHPAESFDPWYTMEQSLMEAAALAGIPRQERAGRVVQLARTLSLDPSLLSCRPSELSGGQAQRFAIARALLFGPSIIAADEPTSALDVSLQARVVEIFRSLKNESLSLLVVTHDLHVARALADTVYVMLGGRVVEFGPGEVVLQDPVHPYTRDLVDSSTRPVRPEIPAPLPAPDPSGCPYTSRCPAPTDECTTFPTMRNVRGRWVACHAPLD